jgi:VanZ family protein
MAAGRVPIVRSWLAALALGAAAFTWYGSLVPFEFKERTWDDAVDNFAWVWQNRVWPQSRSDALANLMLGIPLGFGILGALRLDKPGGVKTVAVGLLVIPCCLAFASAVEFSQLWCNHRTSAASDALAQMLGAAVGVALWLGFGEAIVRFARNLWDSPNLGGRHGRALLVYVAFLGAVQTLPWDITASPGKWARRDVTWQPFEELSNPTKYRVPPLDKSRVWVEQIALFAPVGLIAAGLPGSFSRWGGIGIVAVAGYGLGMVMELAQWPVATRTPSVTDILIDGTAVTLGWVVGRAIRGGWLPIVVPLLGWLALLAIYHWWPLDFDPSAVRDRLADFSLVPFLSLESKHRMMWLEEVTVKMLIVAPVGAAAANRGATISVLLSLMVGLTFECGQLALPRHFPSLTDVVLAGLGGFAGWATWTALTRDPVIDLTRTS